MAQLHWNSFSWKHVCFRLKQCLEYSFSALSFFLTHHSCVPPTPKHHSLNRPPHHHFSLAFLFLSLDFSCSPSLSGWIFSQLCQSYISEVFNITAYKCPLKIVMFNVSCSSLIPSSKQEISPTLYPELILWLLICDLKKRDVLASKIGNKIYFLFPPAFFSIPNLQKMDKVFIVHRRW